MRATSLELTLTEWIRAAGNEYRFIREVFAKNDEIDRRHRANCRLLVRRGKLKAEDDDGVTLGPFTLDENKRYYATD
jgi:hypothetical protein